MTKKHFIELADHIRSAIDYRARAGLPPKFDSAAIESLADYCYHQNRRFNRSRWIGYIEGANGPNGGSVKPAKPIHDPTDPVFTAAV